MQESLKKVLEFISRVSVRIEAPYIDFGILRVTPAFVLYIAYFIILVIVCRYCVVHNDLAPKFLQWNTYSKGTKKHIIRSVGGFVIGGIACWYLPPFFEEESSLVQIFAKYLQYEPIIVLAIFVFLCSALLSEKNKYKHVAVANRFLQFVIPISVATGLFFRRIDLGNFPNWIILFFASVFYFLLLVTDIEQFKDKKIMKKQDDGISYNPVEKIEQLFPQHRAQAEILANIISDSSSDPFSICLSGKWGTGKTSVINGVIELLNKKDNYEFIHINATELDDKKTLLNYFMSEVKSCLKERGIYVGIASEYEEFLSSTIGTVITESFGSFFQKRIFGGEKDYREQKKSLENLLSDAFAEGKIVLIIDDIERCQPDIAREYLFLIKEVATMKNCVSIFVTDYDILLEFFRTDRNDQTKNVYGENISFLEKYFNYRINLYNEEPKDILEFYDRRFKDGTPEFISIYNIIGMSPGTWFKQVLEGLDACIEEQKEKVRNSERSEGEEEVQKNKLNKMKQRRTIFVQYMQNPRNVVKFYKVFGRNIHRCHEQLYGVEIEENERAVVNKFIRVRNIGQIVIFLSFVEVYMPDELQQLIRNGAEYIEAPFYEKNVTISEGRQLLIEIACMIIYEEYSGSTKKTNYIKEEMRHFINRFLKPNAELKKLIKPFTTQEAEWVAAIQNGNEMLLDKEWNRMVKMILEDYSDENSERTIQWKKDMFSILLEYAKKKIEMGAWEIDRLFSIFENDKKGRIFAEGIGLLHIFWDVLQNLDKNLIISEEVVNNTIFFAGYYSYQRVDSTYKLVQCINTYENSSKIENIKEKMFDSTQTLEKNLLGFVNGISECIPDLCFSHEGWFERFQELTKYIQNYFKEKGFLKYKDVKREVDHMLDSVNELYCLSQILEWIQKETCATNIEAIKNGDYSKIDQNIQYFGKLFEYPEKYFNKEKNVERQFENFFIYLKNSSDIKLNSRQIEQLHDLVTIFVEETESYGLFYRKILLHKSIQSDKSQSTDIESN